MSRTRSALLGLAMSMAASAASAQPADVIHWWTSGGESKAVGVFAAEPALQAAQVLERSARENKLEQVALEGKDLITQVEALAAVLRKELA